MWVLSIRRAIFDLIFPFFLITNMGFHICNFLFRFLYISCCYLIFIGAFSYFRVAHVFLQISVVKVVFAANYVANFASVLVF